MHIYIYMSYSLYGQCLYFSVVCFFLPSVHGTSATVYAVSRRRGVHLPCTIYSLLTSSHQFSSARPSPVGVVGADDCQHTSATVDAVSSSRRVHLPCTIYRLLTSSNQFFLARPSRVGVSVGPDAGQHSSATGSACKCRLAAPLHRKIRTLLFLYNPLLEVRMGTRLHAVCPSIVAARLGTCLHQPTLRFVSPHGRLPQGSRSPRAAIDTCVD